MRINLIVPDLITRFFDLSNELTRWRRPPPSLLGELHSVHQQLLDRGIEPEWIDEGDLDDPFVLSLYAQVGGTHGLGRSRRNDGLFSVPNFSGIYDHEEIVVHHNGDDAYQPF